MAPSRFTHFAAVDWSGAAGERHRGIAVAICNIGDAAPMLVRPGHRWSRAEVLDWLVRDTPDDTLIGFDLGISLPFADAGAFFPGWANTPPDARRLWALVEAICADEAHLGVGSFVDHPELSRHFRRHGGREGDLFRLCADGGNGLPATGGRGRFRVTEHAQARAGAAPTSNFNLIGAAQVGKGSLSGMRLLHRLPRDIPVWPIDPLPASGRVVVEIYTTIAALAAGRRAGASKIRDGAGLDAALAAIHSRPAGLNGPIPDHAADALLTAAWLRGAAQRADLWAPKGMTPQIARTEGWTFGVG
ncbi:hypothetical protein GTZ99_06260 [Novosphingobium sp. FSY-8]|uniref:RNase H-like nuclease n=1 Tax=Novosphingobium ovatum TaxID=1908523 RepID=A0ABW9XCA7_9SPHN|nr:hypothetical protein [Novosphingobium ovatum]